MECSSSCEIPTKRSGCLGTNGEVWFSDSVKIFLSIAIGLALAIAEGYFCIQYLYGACQSIVYCASFSVTFLLSLSWEKLVAL